MTIYDKTGTVILDVEVDDTSFRIRKIMGAHSVTLNYSLTDHVEIPIYSYIEHQGQRYTLWRPENFTKHGMRNLEYTVVFGSYQELAKRYKYKNLSAIPYELKFPITAKPIILLQLFVDNMNLHDSGWKVGDCIDAPEKLFSINHEYCYDVLVRMAAEWKTEFEFEEKTVHFRKVEKFKDAPLALSYGKGNGFVPGIARQNRGDKAPATVLYIQGGSQNIDYSKYGSHTLLLPKNQLLEYDGRKYKTDENGMYITRADKELTTYNEDSYDASDIYPSRVGSVTDVIVVDADKNLYDFKDSTIPADLNFENQLIEGETMTVIFQSGSLTGREFEVKYIHANRLFEIVPAQMDGYDLPNINLKPAVGDKYAVFHISLPDSYVCDNDAQEGASWDMFREAVRYLRDCEDEQFSVSGEMDGIWAAQRWLEIGGKIVPGGYVSLSDTQFQVEPLLIRMTGVTDYINRPHSPKIDLSNAPIPGYVGTDLSKIDANEVVSEAREKNQQLYTARRFRDAEELANYLGMSLLNFQGGINPITVHAMMQYLGDKNLQFIFVDNKTSPKEIDHTFTYNPVTKVFSTPAGVIQHQTIGIDTLAPGHNPSEYKYWDIAEYVSPPLDDPKALWLYTRVEKNGTNGTFLLSETSYDFDSDPNYYYLLTGFLNSEFSGTRSWTTLYGWSEWTPGMMRVNKIVSNDGKQFWDMLNMMFKIGDDNVSLSFNMPETPGQLVLKGTLVQSPSGVTEPIEVPRGTWNNTSTYYRNEIVYYNGSSYRCISNTPVINIVPTNATYWAAYAVKGADGYDGSDGTDGRDGTDGKNGRIFTYQGEYVTGKTYIGNLQFAQVVKSGSTYYYTTDTAGSFSNIAPPNSSKWIQYGASFESIATGLLFAEKALIAGLNFYNYKIESTQSYEGAPVFMVNGETGEWILQGQNGWGLLTIRDGKIFWRDWIAPSVSVLSLEVIQESYWDGEVIRIIRRPRVILTNLPGYSTSLKSGELYRDGEFVKVKS